MNLNDRIREAIEEVWTGRLEVVCGGQHEGQIVFCQGRIAWAACRGQSETLGAFLWRLGRLTREQLKTVQKRFENAEGKKRLGAILEESGMMSRPVLRRCLLLHTRSAMDGLLDRARTDSVQVVRLQGDYTGDELILFGPEEVLPTGWTDAMAEWNEPDATWVRGWSDRTPDNEILEELMDIQGYRAAAVIGRDGDVLAAHRREDGIDLQMLSVSVAAMLEAAHRTVRPTSLGGVGLVTLDCDAGGMTARWIDEKRNFLVFVLTEQNDNPSLTRYAISAPGEAWGGETMR